MRIIEKVSEMQQQADAWRREGKRIAFVPTMGYLHQGHLDLLRAARRFGNLTLMSIFVNPSQFGPEEDYQSYPRDLDRDIRLATEVGTDVAFVPLPEEVYPEGYQTHVEVTEVTRNLCGRSRPVFLRGVATVVTKLFHIVKPHAAVFGEKDFQQLVTIRRMVRDLNMDVDIIGHPIVRESDGLAMSSRNVYLNAEQRRIALRLNQSLRRARVLVDAGERRAEALLAMVKDFLTGDDGVRIDYVQLCHPETLEDVSLVDGPTLLALAAWVGPARLIDNCVLRPPS